MSRVTIWPDIYKEQGHWLPCINLAKTLRDANYGSVDFMGIPDTQSIVQPYGFTFNTILSNIYPAGYSLENKLEPVDQRWKPAHLMPIVRGALDNVFKPPTGANGIIGGYFTSLETLMIARKYGIPFVIITTFLRHPEDLPSLHAKTKLLYMPKAVSQALIDGIVGPASAGMSIDEFVSPLDAGNRPEIIPCPKDFDFQAATDPDWVHRPTTSYVEPMVLRTPIPPASPIIPDPTAIPANFRLIYATSGSQVQDYEFRARIFFKNMISMMQTSGMDTYYLVLAVGSKLLAQLNLEYGVGTQNPTLPKNVALFDWVSQLDIVKNADAVFMHGGLATIKESIWEQVPIIIVPLGKDQMDNALRIKRTGVGVAAEVADLSPTDLRQLFTEATGSTWIRQNLANMKAIFQAAETAKPSFNIIKSAIPFP